MIDVQHEYTYLRTNWSPYGLEGIVNFSVIYLFDDGFFFSRQSSANLSNSKLWKRDLFQSE